VPLRSRRPTSGGNQVLSPNKPTTINMTQEMEGRLAEADIERSLLNATAFAEKYDNFNCAPVVINEGDFVDNAVPGKLADIGKEKVPETNATAEPRPQTVATTATEGIISDSNADGQRPKDRPSWKEVYEAYRASRPSKIAKVKAIAKGRRDRDAKAKRIKRDSPEVLRKKRLEALMNATAKPKGDKQIEQLKGEEQTILNFRDAIESARCKHGRDVTDNQIGAEYLGLSQLQMTKSQCKNKRRVIERLEAPGGVWCRWAKVRHP
jgi:hypothetical protein